MSAARRIADKILSAGEARARIAEWEARGERVARARGVFDAVGVEHLRYLVEARGGAARLAVWLEDDAGAGAPLLGARERATLVAALACVDLVILGDSASPGGEAPAPSSARIRRRVLEAHGRSS